MCRNLNDVRPLPVVEQYSSVTGVIDPNAAAGVKTYGDLGAVSAPPGVKTYGDLGAVSAPPGVKTYGDLNTIAPQKEDESSIVKKVMSEQYQQLDANLLDDSPINSESEDMAKLANMY